MTTSDIISDTLSSRLAVPELELIAFEDFQFPSLDDFLSSNPIPDPSASPPSPRPAESSSRLERSRSPNEPVPIGTSITTTYTKDLYEALQPRGDLAPHFEYTDSRNGFSCTLNFVDPVTGVVVKALGPERRYPSKKHAKEAAAGLGLEFVKTLPASTKAASKKLGTPLSDDNYAEPVGDERNWVGEVNTFCQQRNVVPEYDFFQIRQGYSCEMKLPSTLALAGVESKVFGDRNKAFRVKRDAKVAASKEGLEWINSFSAQTLQSSTAEVLTATAPKTVALKGSTITVRKDWGAAEKVAKICPLLSLSAPAWTFQPDPHATGFYDVTVRIRRLRGPKDVQIGPLNNLFGKKKAKDAVATYVLNWLHKEAATHGVKIVEE